MHTNQRIGYKCTVAAVFVVRAPAAAAVVVVAVAVAAVVDGVIVGFSLRTTLNFSSHHGY